MTNEQGAVGYNPLHLKLLHAEIIINALNVSSDKTAKNIFAVIVDTRIDAAGAKPYVIKDEKGRLFLVVTKALAEQLEEKLRNDRSPKMEEKFAALARDHFAVLKEGSIADHDFS